MDSEQELLLRQLQRGSPLNLGHKIVYFKVAYCQQTFAVHEDLICASSPCFKAGLQEKRKPIEGECSICHEVVDVAIGNATFCRESCGQNFHEHCIAKWIESQRRSPTCPLCQNNWAEPVKQPLVLDDVLDQQAVTVYIDWLYTEQLRLTQCLLRNDNESHFFLLKAWKVADIMGDVTFRLAICDRYTELRESKEFKHIDITSIRYIYEDFYTEDMYLAVLETAVAKFSTEWYDSISDELPESFKVDLHKGLSD